MHSKPICAINEILAIPTYLHKQWIVFFNKIEYNVNICMTFVMSRVR